MKENEPMFDVGGGATRVERIYVEMAPDILKLVSTDGETVLLNSIWFEDEEHK